MLKKALNSLKIILPVALAIYLFWTTFSDPEKVAEIKRALNEVKYIYIILALVFVTISHLSRAQRWKYLIEPLGYKTKFSNSFYSIMIGYVMNMLIPRAGEISRAAFFSRFEKIPADKTFGTIAAERVVDLILLLSITAITFYVERETAWDQAVTLYQDFVASKDIRGMIPWLIGGAVIGIAALIFIFSKPKIRDKFKEILKGLWEGLKTVITTKKKWHFLAHTVVIWACYILMFYIPFLSLEATKGIGLSALMVAFVFGSFSIVFTQGGAGAYHVAVGIALGMYGYSVATGEALGLIIWAAQAAYYIVVGLLCLYLINKTNDNYLGHTATDPS